MYICTSAVTVKSSNFASGTDKPSLVICNFCLLIQQIYVASQQNGFAKWALQCKSKVRKLGSANLM